MNKIYFPLSQDDKGVESNRNGEENPEKRPFSGNPGPSSNQKEDSVSHWAAIPPLQTPGHTGYLTYATYM